MSDHGFDEEAVTVARTSIGAPGARASTFVVTVVDGPDRGAKLVLDGSQPRVLVGKGPACALKLADPTVSRRHVSLEVEGDRLRLCDLGSTNGTRVGPMAVVEGLIHGGETVRIGDTTLRFDLTEAEHPVALGTDASFGRVIGGSPQMRRIYPLCRRLAATDVPMVIEGETGTGKELLAEAIHEEGPRANGPFVIFDCTTVAANLVESALFGHERGAFTGAVQQRKGVFEQAHGGTLFLDEIGDLDLALQPKLLRALQRAEVQRVGGDRWIKVDVRVIAATRRDLDREVQEGRFRDDLFFRLAVARVELPPLRRRDGDVALLARRFFGALGAGTPPPDVVERLLRREWPGNVRELYNAVARHIALGDLTDSERETRAAPPRANEAGDLVETVLAADLPLARARERLVEEFERRYVERALDRHGGNVRRAAEAAGVARRYFQILRARQSK